MTLAEDTGRGNILLQPESRRDRFQSGQGGLLRRLQTTPMDAFGSARRGNKPEGEPIDHDV
ncbi:hypothetical protein [Aquamicrobium terrae]|uniref:AbrB/MazE/SpoVT family DNA-binding domain-containing protein n=1 Tax=Aquamicrobium terrae TaxID=1324945 RepID=A0ABV2N2G4_9HYPH